MADASSIEKNDTLHKEALYDHDVHLSKEEAEHLRVLTPEEKIIEKKLRKKIDTLIMPLVVLVYLLNYIDRNNYAAARLQGLVEDLGMSDTQYQLGLSILFVGYVLMQVPSNLLLNYCGRPAYYLSFFIIAWGLVSTLTSQVTNPEGMIACRFILGVVEAPFFPGVLFYLSKWYTKQELNLRMSIFYSGSLISGAFGNLIAAGILNGLDGVRGLTAWQWLYIIEGVITVAVGIVVAFVLPDFPDTWRLLSPEMKAVANRRMALDAAEADVDVGGGMSQLSGLKAAMTDPKTYILALAYHGITGAAGFQNFYPTLTASLYPNLTGFTLRVRSLLLCAPPYIFTVIWSLSHGLASDKVGNRFWFYTYPVPIVIAGALVFMFTDSFGGRYFSLFMLNAIFVMNGTIYAWIANAIPRPPAKRAAALAFMNSIGNAASIWTPFTYGAGDGPHYLKAMGINIGLVGIAGICGVIMRFYLQYQNRQLERMENSDAQLTERDMKKLEKTAEMEQITIAEARALQKGYRYII